MSHGVHIATRKRIVLRIQVRFYVQSGFAHFRCIYLFPGPVSQAECEILIQGRRLNMMTIPGKFQAAATTLRQIPDEAPGLLIHWQTGLGSKLTYKELKHGKLGLLAFPTEGDSLSIEHHREGLTASEMRRQKYKMDNPVVLIADFQPCAVKRIQGACVEGTDRDSLGIQPGVSQECIELAAAESITRCQPVTP